MNPILTIVMAIACIVVYYILYFVPGLIPFFGGSLFSIVVMWLSYRAFISIEAMNNKLEEDSSG